MSIDPESPTEIIRPPITIGVVAILTELLLLVLWRLSVQYGQFLLPPFLIRLYFHNPILIPLAVLAIAIYGAVRRPTKFCVALAFVAGLLVFVTPVLMDVEPEPMPLPNAAAVQTKGENPRATPHTARPRRHTHE